MCKRYTNPDQLELFEKALQREELPLDAQCSSFKKESLLPPNIATVVIDLKTQLDRLKIG